MNAYIITGMNSGLGDMYSTIYSIYLTQEKLKEMGYKVKTYVDFGLNPYKMNNENRDVFFRIFKLDSLDNFTFFTSGFSPHEGNFPERNETKLVIDNSKIYYVYVDNIIDGVENLDNFPHMENYRKWIMYDEWPKLNFLTDEVVEHCEEKLKSFPDNFYCIHYRPFELNNQNEELSKSITLIKNFIEKHQDRPIFVFTQFEILKNELKNCNYKNLYYNDYVYKGDLSTTRSLGLTDEELIYFFKSTLFEMYAMSKSEKIFRICSWWSVFLFFSASYNQTKLSNNIRFFDYE